MILFLSGEQRQRVHWCAQKRLVGWTFPAYEKFQLLSTGGVIFSWRIITWFTGMNERNSISWRRHDGNFAKNFAKNWLYGIPDHQKVETCGARTRCRRVLYEVDVLLYKLNTIENFKQETPSQSKRLLTRAAFRALVLEYIKAEKSN